jgi:hypothetical protein
MIVLPFPQRSKARVHFTGYLFGRIRHLVGKANDAEAITITPIHQNHLTGLWVASVQVEGDENRYELTLRPVTGDAK